jgi:hypothetical protein
VTSYRKPSRDITTSKDLSPMTSLLDSDPKIELKLKCCFLPNFGRDSSRATGTVRYMLDP